MTVKPRITIDHPMKNHSSTIREQLQPFETGKPALFQSYLSTRKRFRITPSSTNNSSSFFNNNHHHSTATFIIIIFCCWHWILSFRKKEGKKMGEKRNKIINMVQSSSFCFSFAKQIYKKKERGGRRAVQYIDKYFHEFLRINRLVTFFFLSSLKSFCFDFPVFCH